MATLALWGGEPVKKTPFPVWPHFDDHERAALLEVLESGQWWRTPGTRTLEFEEAFARYHDARHGIAVTNGTAALEVSLAALGIGPGDEVIVPDYTFVATASAVLFTGALPVLVDVTAGTYCLDPDLAEAAITPRTKAIVVVHVAGHPADMDRFVEIAHRHKVYLVEDSAHAHGSEWRGQKVGALGDFGTFSFQQSKLMTAGEGGIIVTNHDDLERRARSIHDCGRMPGQWYYAHFVYGSNYRLSEWQGAVLLQQLARLDEQAAVRCNHLLAHRIGSFRVDLRGPRGFEHGLANRHGRHMLARLPVSVLEGFAFARAGDAVLNVHQITVVLGVVAVTAVRDPDKAGRFKRELKGFVGCAFGGLCVGFKCCECVFAHGFVLQDSPARVSNHAGASTVETP